MTVKFTDSGADYLEGLAVQTISSNTTTVGNIIDLSGFNAAEFLVYAATITDGLYTPLIEEGDDSGLSDAAAVPDARLSDTEANAALAAGDDNTVKKIGLITTKQFARLSFVSTSASTGGSVGALVRLGLPGTGPIAQN